MRCPFCSKLDAKVIDSRPKDDGYTIRRRRQCISCDKRYTTYEKIEQDSMLVIKKNNSTQPFDRNKILNGLLRACEKRSIPPEKIELLLSAIELYLFNSYKTSITTNEIGELVLEKLKIFDEVAYIRFASVYKDFKNINTFLQELNKIQRNY